MLGAVMVRAAAREIGGLRAWCVAQVSVAVSETTKHGSAGPDAGGTNTYSLFLQIFTCPLGTVTCPFGTVT